jgi:hypothetical protein
MSLRNLISLGFNSPQLAAVKSVQSTFRYLVACREVVHFQLTERSDIHKYSIVNIQSSIPACPGWV